MGMVTCRACAGMFAKAAHTLAIKVSCVWVWVGVCACGCAATPAVFSCLLWVLPSAPVGRLRKRYRWVSLASAIKLCRERARASERERGWE